MSAFYCCEEKEKGGKYSLGSNLYIAHLNQADRMVRLVRTSLWLTYQTNRTQVLSKFVSVRLDSITLINRTLVVQLGSFVQMCYIQIRS